MVPDARARLDAAAARFASISPARIVPPARAAAEGLGPRLHYLSTEGLVVDFVQGAELTEGDIHADAALRPRLLGTIASHLAQLHSLRLPHTRMPAAGAAGSAADIRCATASRPPTESALSCSSSERGACGPRSSGAIASSIPSPAWWPDTSRYARRAPYASAAPALRARREV